MSQMQRASVITSNKHKSKYSFGHRAELAQHPLTKKLFTIMERKKTNLAHNPDVTTKAEFLRLVDAVGPHICILKTHIDIINDFDDDLIIQLLALAKKHDFLIFEDRKFADIGSVVQKQYRDGVYHIADWADMVNAHVVAGPGIIHALKEVGLSAGRGLLLIAQMSSKDNLVNSYLNNTIAMAEQNKDFVFGFICQEQLLPDPGLVHITPGVKLVAGSDQLNQQYRTPYNAIVDQGNDIVIVGRGIYESEDPATIAREYKEAAWNAYQQTIFKFEG